MAEFITREPIDIAGLIASVAGVDMGAAAVFLGTVRSSPEDGAVVAIDYSAYEEMVAAEFLKIMAEATERWPEGRFAAQHRIGRISVGEASIAIVAATPHRADSFEACRYIIEEVKVRLPVWKKEHFEGGTDEWRENEPGDRAD